MKNILIFSIMAFAISCSVSKEKFLHPEVLSPDIYEVLLDNEDVKVMMVTF